MQNNDGLIPCAIKKLDNGDYGFLFNEEYVYFACEKENLPKLCYVLTNNSFSFYHLISKYGEFDKAGKFVFYDYIPDYLEYNVLLSIAFNMYPTYRRAQHVNLYDVYKEGIKFDDEITKALEEKWEKMCNGQF